jgi:chorismate mutase
MYSAESRASDRVHGCDSSGRPHDKGWNNTEGFSWGKGMSEKIAELRQKIDEIDEKILLLLKERFEIAKEIGWEKRKYGMPLRDFKRENEKYKEIMEKALKLKLDSEAVKEVYRRIIDMSMHVQEG